MNVYITDVARRQLRAIHDYISQHSLRYAQRMVDRILRRVEILGNFPLIGAVVEEYGADDVREIVEHTYRIIYRTYPDRIDVVSIIHGARELPPQAPM